MIRNVAASSCVALLAFLGCAGQSADELFDEGMSAASDSSTFAVAEKSFSALLSRYPDDPRNDQVVFKLAEIAQNRNRPGEAIALYQKLVQDYPHSARAYQAQFMVGFLYEEQLRDTANAKIAYQKVLDNYPDSDLADDAEVSILHIGENPEEWITFESAAPEESPAVSE